MKSGEGVPVVVVDDELVVVLVEVPVVVDVAAEPSSLLQAATIEIRAAAAAHCQTRSWFMGPPWAPVPRGADSLQVIAQRGAVETGLRCSWPAAARGGRGFRQPARPVRAPPGTPTSGGAPAVRACAPSDELAHVPGGSVARSWPGDAAAEIRGAADGGVPDMPVPPADGEMMGLLLNRLDAACAVVRERGAPAPKIGLVLGSGLGAFAEGIESPVRIGYADIPNMPVPRVSGHAGALWVGRVGDVSVACLQGRVHCYEGHDLADVVFGVRLLGRLGCTAVLLTNAAGGLRPTFQPGSLMLLTDHLNLMGPSPLVGPNDDELGPRFPDLTRAYDARLGALARDAAAEVGVELEEGVYAGLLGPQYETPAEIAMLRTLGADAVGMSTVPEVIALRHMGVRAAAVSCITNLAAGMTAHELSHGEVEQAARGARDRFTRLLEAWIGHIGGASLAPHSIAPRT